MLVLATCLVSAFVIGSMFRDDVDDDQGPGGGMMVPSTSGA